MSMRMRGIISFLLLTLCGLAGNIANIPMFFGVDQIFGSIFVLLAVYLFGPWWGLLSALIAHSYTMVLWQHPYAYLSFCLEALVVGLLLPRYLKNLFLADALYWLLLGMPLAWLLYDGVLELESTQVALITLKQPANGLFNALLAVLLLNFFPLCRRLQKEVQEAELSFRDLLLSLIMALVFFTSFVSALMNSRRVMYDNIATINTDLQRASHYLQRVLTQPTETRDLADLLHKSLFQEGLRYSLLDTEGRIIATSRSDRHPGMYLLKPEQDELLEVSPGHYHVLPKTQNMAAMLRWKRSYYLLKTPLTDKNGWQLATELPIAPYIDRLQAYYIYVFTIMLVTLFIALSISILIQNQLTRSLNQLADITYNLPQRLLDKHPIHWPQTRLREINAMTRNIQQMAVLLSDIFRDSEERYQTLFERTTDAVFVCQGDGHISTANTRAEALLGLTQEDIRAHRLQDFIAPEERAQLEPLLRAKHGESPIRQHQFTLLNQRRQRIPVELAQVQLHLKGHDVQLNIIKDISDRRQAEENLQLIAKVFENTSEAIIITDADTRIIKVNKAFAHITGFQPAEALGKTPRILHSSWQDKSFYDAMWDKIKRYGEWQGELWNRRKDATPYAEWLSITALYNQHNEVTNYIGIFIDITEQRKAQERIHHLAFFDPLTELPNRALFMDRLQQALERAKRRNKKLALLFLDLDNFKTINDTLGHHAGDLLLQYFAQRVGGLIRNSDTLARLGGDEFTLILEDIGGVQNATGIARKVLDIMRQPFVLEGQEIFTTTSIGICLFPDNGQTVEDLMRHADAAMYRAKEDGKNGFELFVNNLNRRMEQRFALEAELRKALREKDQLRLYFQAQLDTRDDRLCGFEALLRWMHPLQGEIAPEVFLPVAEDSGLMIPLGEWLFESCCQHLRDWSAQSPRPLRLAFNISASQLRHNDFVEFMEHCLHRYGLPARSFELELTEGILMNSGAISERLSYLKKSGFALVIDDFGSGYSSLSYLKIFAIDKLKIARPFIQDLPDDAQSCDIVQAIIQMARALHMRVVAEGVEDKVQLQFIRDKGCEEYQGALFSLPVSAERVPSLLKNA